MARTNTSQSMMYLTSKIPAGVALGFSASFLSSHLHSASTVTGSSSLAGCTYYFLPKYLTISFFSFRQFKYNALLCRLELRTVLFHSSARSILMEAFATTIRSS